jgi:hypothetical protein
MTAHGRVEPKRGSDSPPETCHSEAIRYEISEHVGKDRLWPILLKNSDLPSLLKQIAPMRHWRSDQRPAGPTAIDVAAASHCVALKAIDATRATRDLKMDF